MKQIAKHSNLDHKSQTGITIPITLLQKKSLLQSFILTPHSGVIQPRSRTRELNNVKNIWKTACAQRINSQMETV